MWLQTVQNPVSCISELRKDLFRKLPPKAPLKFYSTSSSEILFIQTFLISLEETPF